MKLLSEHKNLILEEFDFAIRKMKESQTADQKLFYFSSTYGVLSRIFNINFDPELVFIHAVLNNSYTNVLGRFKAIKSGETAVGFTDDYFDKLTGCIEELADKIKKDSSLYDTLIKISLLTFVTTGNGAYLLEKGSFKI